MNNALKLIFAFILILSTGCQAMIYGTAADFDKLKIGMTKEQVIGVLGSPTATEANGDRAEEYLIYKKMRHAISDWPRIYQVTIRDGHVVKWYEQPENSSSNVNVNVYN